jgi:HPt (histidine-containing phosphotransfer) domain-containing protein
MSAAPLVDAAVLDDLIEHIGTEATHGIFVLFVEECRELVAMMAPPAGTPEAARRAAHSLKSSAGQLGAAALAEAAERVETANAAEIPGCVATLAECAAQTEAALAARLTGP